MANRPPGPEAFSIVQLCSSGPHDKGSAERAHAQAAAVVTYMYVDTPELIEDRIHRKASQHGFKTLVPLDAEDNGKLLLPVTVGEETIIPDFLETGRKDMHHEPADELTGFGSPGLRPLAEKMTCASVTERILLLEIAILCV